MSDIDRFWSKVDVGAPDECWLWRAYVAENGYGRFWLRGHKRTAHWACLSLRDELPDGWHVHHRCRNRACVNPAHLEALPQSLHNSEHRTGCAKHGEEFMGPFTECKGGVVRRWCLACTEERNRAYSRVRVRKAVAA